VIDLVSAAAGRTGAAASLPDLGTLRERARRLAARMARLTAELAALQAAIEAHQHALTRQPAVAAGSLVQPCKLRSARTLGIVE